VPPVTLTLNDIVMLGAPLVAVVVWLIRLEGRVNGNAKEISDNKAEVAEHFATREDLTRVDGGVHSLTAQIVDVKAALVRIENKIDRQSPFFPHAPSED
jgi:hypothetical protein